LANCPLAVRLQLPLAKSQLGWVHTTMGWAVWAGLGWAGAGLGWVRLSVHCWVQLGWAVCLLSLLGCPAVRPSVCLGCPPLAVRLAVFSCPLLVRCLPVCLSAWAGLGLGHWAGLGWAGLVRSVCSAGCPLVHTCRPIIRPHNCPINNNWAVRPQWLTIILSNNSLSTVCLSGLSGSLGQSGLLSVQLACPSVWVGVQ